MDLHRPESGNEILGRCVFFFEGPFFNVLFRMMGFCFWKIQSGVCLLCFHFFVFFGGVGAQEVFQLNFVFSVLSFILLSNKFPPKQFLISSFVSLQKALKR